MAVFGTFTGTGTSPSITGKDTAITMSFAGTASVDIEKRMNDGTWIKTATAITSTYDNVYDGLATLRLNCTAYTDAVKYELIPPDSPD